LDGSKFNPKITGITRDQVCVFGGDRKGYGRYEVLERFF
jgi:hypothetical protein